MKYKWIVVILLAVMLVGVTFAYVDTQPKVSNEEYEALIQRIGELEQELGNHIRDSNSDMDTRLYQALEEWKTYTGNDETNQQFNSWLVVAHPDIHEYYRQRE